LFNSQKVYFFKATKYYRVKNHCPVPFLIGMECGFWMMRVLLPADNGFRTLYFLKKAYLLFNVKRMYNLIQTLFILCTYCL